MTRSDQRSAVSTQPDTPPIVGNTRRYILRCCQQEGCSRDDVRCYHMPGENIRRARRRIAMDLFRSNFSLREIGREINRSPSEVASILQTVRRRRERLNADR